MIIICAVSGMHLGQPAESGLRHTAGSCQRIGQGVRVAADLRAPQIGLELPGPGK